VNQNSATWIAGSGGIPVNYPLTGAIPVNYVNSTTPIQNLVFYYTPANNGAFLIPGYPTAKIQNGWFFPPLSSVDRHFFTINPVSCSFQEMYDYYSAGQKTACSTCTSQSGVSYHGSDYALPAGGSTNAAGTFIMPLELRLQELENVLATGGTINHALAMTLQNGYIGLNSFIWPATTSSVEGSVAGVVPYGARFRLKANFNISSFSPIAQILLTQLKQYGIILTDGGYGWQVTTEYTKWPPAYQSAFAEIGTANIGPANFEAVDESSLMVSPSSGATTLSETVVATSVSNPAQKATQQVVLTGVTLNLAKDDDYIQAGAPAQQLVAYVNGSSNTGVNWTMSPTVGTLTSTGLYTPPGTAASITTATVKATSAANSNVSATMQLTILPSGTVRLYSCTSDNISECGNNYVDSKGNTWYPFTGDDGGTPYNNGGSWPSTPDITLYKAPYYAFGGDMRFDIAVPNGTYNVTGKFASTNVGQAGQLVSLETQGQVIYPNVDIYAQAGGSNLPIDFTLPATVTNGQLSFVLRRVAGNFNDISALQIAPISLSGNGSSAPPTPPTGLSAIIE
jgi:hypothetical protein